MLRISLALISLGALSCASQPTAARTHNAEVATSPHVVIEDDYEAARAAALAEQRPLLVNFTGYTCINCRVMETTVFVHDDVAAALAPYVEARLHQDATDAAVRAANARITDTVAQSKAMPIYVAIDPRTGKEIARFSGLAEDPAPFVAFLEAASGQR